VDGEFDRRPHNPAFKVIYVYSQREGSIDLHFRGSYKAIDPLQGMFAQVILKLEGLPPDPKDERVYRPDQNILAPEYVQRHPGGTGRTGSCGCEHAGENGDHTYYLSQLLLA
jgi:hypothetical protein